MDKNKKIIAFSILGTLIFIGGLVALFMINTLLGIIGIAVIAALLTVLAIIGNKKQSTQESQQDEQDLSPLYNIVTDYDGYDMVFVQGKTNPEIYNNISLMLSNSKYNIKSLNQFNNLTIDSSTEEFYEFFDSWVEDLKNNKFLVHLDNDTTMQDFSNAIVKLVIQNGYQSDISADSLTKKYTDYLNKIGLDSTIKFDILEANIVAGELRKYGLELISLFDGFDNTLFAVIPSSSIERLKDLERSIK